MNYVFSVRNIQKGGFGSEPGATHFLEVPDGTLPDPKHKIRKADWLKIVMKAALHGPQDDGPVGDILIYVHGFNTSQSAMMERLESLSKGLKDVGYEGVVAAFDWPCASTALNYLEDREDAKLTAFRLVKEGIAAFAALQRPDCNIRVHIIAHSMGAFVVREAFDDADDRPAIAGRSWSVSQVLLCGADISASSMADNNPKSNSLYRHAVRVTNYFNPFDEILSLSNVKRIGVAPRVGRVGIGAETPDKAVNINMGNWFELRKDRYKRQKAAPHTFYFYDKDFLEDVCATLKGDVDRGRIEGRFKGSDGNLVLLPKEARR